MKNLKKVIYTSGFIGAGLGLAYFILRKKDQSGTKNNVTQVIPKETIIQILKKMSNEFLTVFNTIAMMYSQVKLRAEGHVSEDELAEFMSQNPQVNEQIAQIENQIYESFNVTKQQVKFSCEVAYKDDKDIIALQREIKSNYDNALTGVQPDIKANIPDNLTPKRTIEILEKITKSNLKKIQQMFLQLKNQGIEINLDDPRVVSAINSIKFEEIQSKILKESGLDQFEDPGSKILSYATQTYKEKNQDNFNEGLMQLELKQRSSMQEIQKNPEDPDIVDKIFSSNNDNQKLEQLLFAKKNGDKGNENVAEKADQNKKPEEEKQQAPQENKDKVEEQKKEAVQENKDKVQEKVAVVEEKKQETVPQQEKKAEEQAEKKLEPQEEKKAEQQPEKKIDQQPENKIEQQQEKKAEQQPAQNIEQQPAQKVEQQPAQKIEQQPEKKAEYQPEMNANQPQANESNKIQ